MEPVPTQDQTFGRFGKYILIGALISGVASGIPLVNILNCCFCLLNMAGIILALHLYLKSAPGDAVSMGEAAGFGAAAGAGAGLIAGILGILTSRLVASLVTSILSSAPPQLKSQLAASSALGVMMIPVNIALYAAFGALGGILGMAIFFKNRKRG
jgi:hypothetical protein